MAGRLKNMFVFFYEEGDILAERILGELEELEDQLADMHVDFVKVSEPGVAEDYDLSPSELPALAHFDGSSSSLPNLYHGDLRQRERVSGWVDETTSERKSSHDKKRREEEARAARRKGGRRRQKKEGGGEAA